MSLYSCDDLFFLFLQRHKITYDEEIFLSFAMLLLLMAAARTNGSSIEIRLF